MRSYREFFIEYNEIAIESPLKAFNDLYTSEKPLNLSSQYKGRPAG